MDDQQNEYPDAAVFAADHCNALAEHISKLYAQNPEAIRCAVKWWPKGSNEIECNLLELKMNTGRMIELARLLLMLASHPREMILGQVYNDKNFDPFILSITRTNDPCDKRDVAAAVDMFVPDAVPTPTYTPQYHQQPIGITGNAGFVVRPDDDDDDS